MTATPLPDRSAFVADVTGRLVECPDMRTFWRIVDSISARHATLKAEGNATVSEHVRAVARVAFDRLQLQLAPKGTPHDALV